LAAIEVEGSNLQLAIKNKSNEIISGLMQRKVERYSYQWRVHAKKNAHLTGD
jgi:hypothetical protein